MVLKSFPFHALADAYQEAAAYGALKSAHGVLIPYCYGAYDVEGKEGIDLLLEKIDGVMLTNHLETYPTLNTSIFAASLLIASMLLRDYMMPAAPVSISAEQHLCYV
jgi:hypothetical protein